MSRPARPAMREAAGSGAPAGGAPRRLLLIQLRWLGDVLLATPALRAARRAFPDARIEVLTGVPGVELLRENPHLDDILPWRPGAAQAIRLARELAGRRYDAVVDLQSNPSSALQVWATGARVRIGLRGRGWRNQAYTLLLPKETRPIYMARQKLALVETLAAASGLAPVPADVRLEIVPGAAARDWARAELERLGLAGAGPIVALTAVARHAHKQWGGERWARVADALAGAGAHVLLTHGPGEREQARAVAERMHAPAAHSGPPGPRHLAALLERCALWVGNDGGAQHIAVAAGLPTVAVLRWQHADVWTDLSPEARQTALDARPILPCDMHCDRCPHRSCLAQVDVERVAAAALRALARATRVPGAEPRALPRAQGAGAESRPVPEAT